MAFSRLNQCINACQEHHDYCRETIGGSTLDKTEKPILPTRVIDIGPPGSRINPRLVCTNGSRGDYVALSHCWGKSQPIKTTKDTLQHHLEGIPWAEFPKTFQHAMRFTREIGLRYLWIDSLCIVQGDREEWLRVSEMMGSAYERAHLVVAAADASDSSGGCFFRSRCCLSFSKSLTLTLQEPPRDRYTCDSRAKSVLTKTRMRLSARSPRGPG